MQICEKISVSILIRSLFLQALWNFERLQNVGFAFVMMPVFKELYPDKDKRIQVIIRHIEFFNTNPYMISIVMGLVGCMEQQLVESHNTSEKNISSLKMNIAGPLAAIGDKLFWATWRPFSALLAIGLTFIIYDKQSMKIGLLPVVFFVVFYNLFLLPFRYWSFWLACKYSEMIVKIVATFDFKHIIDIIRYAALIFLALIIMLYFILYAASLKMVLLFLFVFIMSCVLTEMRITPSVMIIIVILFSMLVKFVKLYIV
jgi:fructoselysine/glucoselysine PTS system EIID component